MRDQAEKLRLFYLQKDESDVSSKKIYSFTSGKGGTGKSFLALNLAFAVANRGKRVLLIDFDLNIGGLHLLLNYNPSSTISDFISGKKLFNEVITPLSDNVDAIFGSSGINTSNQQSEVQLALVFNKLKELHHQYDYMFVDTGAGVNGTVINILKNCEENLFVVNPDPTSVMDAYVLMKYLYQKCNKSVFPVIINKTKNEEEGIVAFEKLQTAVAHFLGIELIHFGSVNYSEKVRQSIIDQELFYSNFPFTQSATQLISIASAINEYQQLANNNHALGKTTA